MSMETLGWSGFSSWAQSGGLIVIGIIIGLILATSAVFSFLIWRKGETKYLWKFIVFTAAAVAVTICGIIIGIAAVGIGDLVGLLAVGSWIFLILFIVVVGLPIYWFIRDTWIAKEEKE